MKKYLPLFMLFVISFLAEAREIEIKKIVSAPSDSYFLEDHKDADWFKKPKSKIVFSDEDLFAKLSYDPKAFPDMVGPNNSNPEWRDLYDLAIDNIKSGSAAGKLNRNVALNNDFWEREVFWSALNENEFEIKIKINLKD